MPSMSLNAHLNETHPLFRPVETADEKREARVEVLNELERDAGERDAGVGPGSVAFDADAGGVVEFLAFGAGDVSLFL